MREQPCWHTKGSTPVFRRFNRHEDAIYVCSKHLMIDEVPGDGDGEQPFLLCPVQYWP